MFGPTPAPMPIPSEPSAFQRPCEATLWVLPPTACPRPCSSGCAPQTPAEVGEPQSKVLVIVLKIPVVAQPTVVNAAPLVLHCRIVVARTGAKAHTSRGNSRYSCF